MSERAKRSEPLVSAGRRASVSGRRASVSGRRAGMSQQRSPILGEDAGSPVMTTPRRPIARLRRQPSYDPMADLGEEFTAAPVTEPSGPTRRRREQNKMRMERLKAPSLTSRAQTQKAGVDVMRSRRWD